MSQIRAHLTQFENFCLYIISAVGCSSVCIKVYGGMEVDT